MPSATDIIEWPAGDTAARVLGATPRRRGPIANLFLSAVATVYGAAVRARNSAFDRNSRRVHQAAIPVISVGNIVAGGAGKTPFTRWLAAELIARGRCVAIVHGGYGSDEPELHRYWHPTAIVIEQRDRVKAVADAAAAGADIVILDDAFQHRRLARDLDLVLVPVESESTQLLPSGPLREPVSGLARADVIVVTRKTASPEQATELANRLRAATGRPCAIAALLPTTVRNTSNMHEQLQGQVVAVASVARPDLMLDNLISVGVQVDKLLAYPDHYDYKARDTAHIQKVAAGRAIVTTEKDAVKIVPLLGAASVWILDQRVFVEEGQDILLAKVAALL